MRDDNTAHILVVGGGPAAVATTLWLLDEGFRVTMAERGDYSEFRVGEHLLPLAKGQLLEMGVPANLSEEGSVQCAEVHTVWGTPKLRYNESILNPLGGGLILDRSVFDANLAEHAKGQGATVLKETTFTGCARSGEGWSCDFNQRGTSLKIDADYIIDATGRACKVVNHLGYEYEEHDKLICIAAVLGALDTGRPATPTILLEACRDGWWYSSALADGRVIATYMTDSDILSGSQMTPLDFWKERLEESPETARRLEPYKEIPRAHVCPSQSRKIEKIYGDGWLAVGDSAMSCDPLSSAGIYKGFAMAWLAARALKGHFSSEAGALEGYDEQATGLYEDYLKTRAYFYRFVTRWPKSDFWLRRQTPLPHDTPIYLDPTALISLSENVSLPDDCSALGKLCPNIDFAILFKQTKSLRPAHELASSYNLACKDRFHDREIITAIQYLIEAGYLDIHNQGPGSARLAG
jgi:flavin-dependent dehydrogenase